MTLYVSDNGEVTRVPHEPKDEVSRARYEDALREFAEAYRERRKDKKFHDLDREPE